MFLLSHQTQAYKPTRDGVGDTSVLDVRLHFIDDPALVFFLSVLITESFVLIYSRFTIHESDRLG